MGWQKYPLFRLLLPFVAGMIIADATAALLTQNITILFISLCLCAIALFMQNGRKSRDSFYPKFGIAAMLFFFIFGAALYTLSFNDIRTSLSPATRQGIVVKNPERKARSWALTMRTDAGARFIAYIDDKSDSTAITGIQIGDTVTFSTRSFSPTCPLDLNEQEQDFAPFRRHLFCSGISATCYIRHDCWSVTPTSASSPNLFTRLRNAMSEAYRNADFTSEEGALIEALTIGDKSRLPQQLKTDYSRAGISHVLALSGFHLAVIFTLLNMMLFAIALPYRWQWIKSLIIIATLWTFTLLAGSPPSLVRAAVMCSLMSIGGCFGRPVLSINSLTLAAFLMLGFNPLLLHDVGFQLSYISVLAICTLAVPCNRKCQEYLYEQFHSKSAFTKASMHILEYFCGIAIVSLVCTLATAPLVAYHFHTIPLLSVLANLLVCLLASVLLYAVALWWILFWWNGARLLLTEVLETIARLMNTVAEWISSVSWATLNWSPSKIQVLLSYALIVSVATYLYRRTATSLKLTLVILVALLATFL